MTYHASDIGSHGLPYPHSHLTARERFALYRGELDAAAAKQRAHRAARPTFGFQREAHTGLVHMGEGA